MNLARKEIATAALVACVGLLPARAGAQACQPTAQTHQRWAVKTRPTPSSVTTQPMTVASMIAEDVPTVSGLPNADNPEQRRTDGIRFDRLPSRGWLPT